MVAPPAEVRPSYLAWDHPTLDSCHWVRTIPPADPERQMLAVRVRGEGACAWATEGRSFASTPVADGSSPRANLRDGTRLDLMHFVAVRLRPATADSRPRPAVISRFFQEAMKPMINLFPRQPVPSLELPTMDGPNWSLAEQTPENFTLIVFYRGLHSPICSRYLVDLPNRLSDFIERGVTVVAVSSDHRERAEETKRRWHIPDVPLAYRLSVAQARQ